MEKEGSSASSTFTPLAATEETLITMPYAETDERDISDGAEASVVKDGKIK